MQGRLSPGLPPSGHSLDLGQLAAQMVLAAAFGAGGVVLGGAPWLIPSRPWALAGFACCAPLALVFVLAGLFFFLRPLPSIGLRVSVSPEGMTWERWGRVVAFPWDQVHTVSTNHPSDLLIGTAGRGMVFLLAARLFLLVQYAIQLRDGRTFTVACLRGLDGLGRTVERESCRCLLPGALQRFRAGETLEFGRLRISREGITKGGYTQPWADVTSIAFDTDGWLMFGSKDRPLPGWIVVSPANVANLAVLLALLRQVKNLLGATWQGNLA